MHMSETQQHMYDQGLLSTQYAAGGSPEPHRTASFSVHGPQLRTTGREHEIQNCLVTSRIAH